MNYFQIENKLLEKVFRVKKFSYYLGNKFDVITDHQALKLLKGINNPQRRYVRWKMLFQGYEYKITKDEATDCSSRLFDVYNDGAY